MQEYEFPYPNEEKGYRLFPAKLEDDALVLFHATPKRNLQAIRIEGFKAKPPLTSVSYSKNSDYCLTHLFNGRQSLEEEAVVIAVRFESFPQRGIQNNIFDIHVHDSNIQPTIIGCCTIPVDYVHK